MESSKPCDPALCRPKMPLMRGQENDLSRRRLLEKSFLPSGKPKTILTWSKNRLFKCSPFCSISFSVSCKKEKCLACRREGVVYGADENAKFQVGRDLCKPIVCLSTHPKMRLGGGLVSDV
jgi:hypothetical protein